MMRENGRKVLLSAVLYTCFLASVHAAQPRDAGAAPLDPPRAHVDGFQDDQPARKPRPDANPQKSPGCLTGPFPVPVPGDLQRIVPPRDSVTLPQESQAVVDLIQQIDEPMVLGYLQDLTAFGPRVTESPACQAAGTYIFNEFQAMGLEVRYHDWSYQGRSDRNIEATLPGTDLASDAIYLICSHYDSVPGSPGADDNGSGTAAVLSSAFVMSQYSFRYTVRFVTFSGEEQGLLGSHEYVAEAFAAGDNLVAVLNADMIGFALTQQDETNVKLFANSASMWLSDYTAGISALYDPYIGLTVLPSGSTSGSDHWYFWQSGYDGVFYHESNFNDFYHSSQDVIANMNPNYAMKVTRLTCGTLSELAELQQDVGGIPAMSQWGICVMGLLVLTAGTRMFTRRRAAAA